MSELADKWRELGKAFIQCADDLEDIAGSAGTEYYPEIIAAKWAFLERHDLLTGNPASGYMASPLLIELAACLAMDNTRRRAAPDIDHWLLELEKHTLLLHNCLTEPTQNPTQKQNPKQIQKQYQTHLQAINTHCWTMICGLEDEIKRIDYYIQSEFGHVNSLKEKRIENQYCIDNVTQYANKIVHLTVHHFARIARDNPDLNRIFFNKLVPVISNCRERFTAFIPKLEKLLWTYRHYDQISKKIWAVHRLLAQGETLINNELTDEQLAESPFNVVEPEQSCVYVDIFEPDNNQALIDVVKSMSRRPVSTGVDIDEDNSPKTLIRDTEEQTELKETILNDYLRQFVARAMASQCTAHTFWQENGQPDIPDHIWLIWSFTQLKKYQEISLEPIALKDSRFSNDSIIYDFEAKFDEF